MNTFSLRLTNFLMDYHPNRVEDTAFIDERGNMAARTFERCSFQGMRMDEAMKEANKVLYQGLYFSPYMTVHDILTDRFGYDPDDDNTEETALQMLPEAQDIFANYPTDDRFEGTPEYNTLCIELTGFIHEYLTNHGLQ